MRNGDVVIFMAAFIFLMGDFDPLDPRGLVSFNPSKRLEVCSLASADEFQALSKLQEPEGRPGG